MAKKYQKVSDPGRIGQKSFSLIAEVQKNSDAGLSWTPLGEASAAIRVGKKTPIMLFNSTGVIGYVAFGDSAMAAPTAPANGIPVLPNSIIILNSGENEFVRASVNTIFAYTADPEANQ